VGGKRLFTRLLAARAQRCEDCVTKTTDLVVIAVEEGADHWRTAVLHTWKAGRVEAAVMV